MKRWPTKTLGELCDVRIGRTPRRDEPRFWGGDAVWVKVGELNGGEITSSKENISDVAVSECMHEPVPSGSLLFSFKLSIGKMAVAGCPLYTNEAIAALPIRNPEELSRSFLCFSLMAESREDTADTAVLGKVLNKEKVRQLSIPVPPLPEQERIVKLLDEADELRKLRSQADRRTAALIPALFHETFGDPATDRRPWPLVKLGNICEVKGGKRLPKGENYSEKPTPYRYIRVSDIHEGQVDETDLRFLKPETQQQIARYTVKEGDLIITIAGTIGMIAPIGESLDGANLTENAAKLVPRFKEKYNVDFLSEVMQTPYVQKQIGLRTGQVTIGKLALFRIKQISFQLPPLFLQKEFAQRVSKIRGLEAEQTASRRRLDDVFQSMLHRAFRGGL